jgi:hypothetical protein
MDMDDDFMGEIEFNLTPQQGQIVRQAIELASRSDDDEFRAVNPLIAIMQWWQTNSTDEDLVKGSPEGTLVQACRRYIAAHEQS